MNLIQRSSLAGALCLSIVAVFLHNPLPGYSIEVSQPASERPCTDAEKRKMRDDYLFVETLPNRSGYTREQIEEKVRSCTILESLTRYLPVDQMGQQRTACLLARTTDQLGVRHHLHCFDGPFRFFRLQATRDID